MRVSVALSLVSHTNVGKTTLARTLLRREVGEVADRAHVTEASEVFELIATPNAVLELWDTPGFGDSRRLIERLRRRSDPVGWFLHQVWDRLTDRPLFCSQRAVQNVRDEADLVLYLVNAAEDPTHAGYVGPELEILSWIGRPVLLVLNQIGEGEIELGQRWREHTRSWPIARDVLPLNAFSRCWVEENVLFDRLTLLLEGSKRDALRELAEAWSQRNLAVFDRSCKRLAAHVAATALDEEPEKAPSQEGGTLGRLSDLMRTVVPPVGPSAEAKAALDARLDRATAELMAGLIEDHGLSGRSAASLERQLADYHVRGRRPPDPKRSALAGAVATGALGGLAADFAAGGLTLGGGAIAGAILGALGGSAWARGYRLLARDDAPRLAWSPEFLERLCAEVLLLYLAVAHFGRGSGEYEDRQRPAHWAQAVDRALAARRSTLEQCWRDAERRVPVEALQARLESCLRSAASAVLLEAYPAARLPVPEQRP